MLVCGTCPIWHAAAMRKVVTGRWLGRFVCAQCDEPSYLDAVVVMGEPPVFWDCICNAARSAEDRRRQALERRDDTGGAATEADPARPTAAL